MRKAVNASYGGIEVISLIEIDIPKMASNEVLVKVNAAGLNPKDIMVRKGKFKLFTGRKMPQAIGFDFAGTIEDANHHDFQKGDKVFGMLNGWRGGCCADYINVGVNELYIMPNNINFKEAAGIPLAGQTALQALRDIGKIKTGQSVCINGASGGVGTLAIQIAKELGAVVTTISSSQNISLCQSLGADNSLSYQQMNILDSKGNFDVFFDVFGNYSFNKTKHLLTAKGVYITTVPNAEILIEQLHNIFRKNKARIVVVKSKAEDLRWLSETINNQKITPIIDKTYDFEEIKVAQQYIESKRAKGKVILEVS